jgi:hypothetical protein
MTSQDLSPFESWASSIISPGAGIPSQIAMEPSTPRVKKHRTNKKLESERRLRKTELQKKARDRPPPHLTPNKNPFFYGNSPGPPAAMMTPLQNKENWGLAPKERETLAESPVKRQQEASTLRVQSFAHTIGQFSPFLREERDALSEARELDFNLLIGESSATPAPTKRHRTSASPTPPSGVPLKNPHPPVVPSSGFNQSFGHNVHTPVGGYNFDHLDYAVSSYIINWHVQPVCLIHRTRVQV